jgi:hypothetical protein
MNRVGIVTIPASNPIIDIFAAAKGFPPAAAFRR